MSLAAWFGAGPRLIPTQSDCRVPGVSGSSDFPRSCQFHGPASSAALNLYFIQSNPYGAQVCNERGMPPNLKRRRANEAEADNHVPKVRCHLLTHAYQTQSRRSDCNHRRVLMARPSWARVRQLMTTKRTNRVNPLALTVIYRTSTVAR